MDVFASPCNVKLSTFLVLADSVSITAVLLCLGSKLRQFGILEVMYDVIVGRPLVGPLFCLF